MQAINPISECASFPQPQFLRTPIKESTLKLNLEVQETGDVTVVYCQGRIVYRDEAAALSGAVAEVLPRTQQVVLDLAGVDAIDSAGLGELIAVLQVAQAQGGLVKLASPTKIVRRLLQLTKLNSVFEIYSTLDEALASWERQPA